MYEPVADLEIYLDTNFDLKKICCKSASVASHAGRNIGNRKIEIHEQGLPS